jgi:hypothetical protein
VVATVGVGAIIAVATTAEGDGPLTVGATQLGYSLGMAVVMVMAALAVTSEYTVGTIRTTFLAVPRRGAALLAKTAVVATLAGLVGLAGAFGSWAVGRLLVPAADLALAGPVEWRQVAGVGAVYAVAAVFAVAVGILVRHTAGAVSIVLGWTLMASSCSGSSPGSGRRSSRGCPSRQRSTTSPPGSPARNRGWRCPASWRWRPPCLRPRVGRRPAVPCDCPCGGCVSASSSGARRRGPYWTFWSTMGPAR